VPDKYFAHLKTTFVCCFLFVFYSISYGVNLNPKNEEDTTSVVVIKEHSPHLATIYSMILPGLGQAYNRKYWKIPIIYGGLGVSLYYLQYNNKRYEQMRKGYKHFIDGDPTTNYFLEIDELVTRNVPDDKIKAQLDYYKYEYRRNRDLTVILTAGIYFINVIDAAVDAHFFDFDVSEDFTLRIEPAIFSRPMAFQAYGFNCTLRF